MRDAEVLRLAAELIDRREPFVLATVVWRRSPSSGKQGAKAVVMPDGRVRGWLGGACAEPAVVREALRALAEGTPRLMFLGPPEELEGRGRDGVLAIPIACQSEGAMEVNVEPMLPAPHLVAIGRSPVADTLVCLAAILGWETVLVDDGGAPEDHPDVGQVLTTLDLEPTGIGPGSFVVVASQGHYDEDAIEQALATPAAYVGLVSSRKRAEAILGYLRDRGVPRETLDRVHAPAGLDLGRLPTHEIAVAILAEIVRERAAGRLASGVPAPAAARHEALDPVCGMTVEVGTARYRSTYEGRTYYFCSAGCLKRFEEGRARFVAAPA